MLVWMFLLLKSGPDLDFSKIWVAYDNMCNLARLGAARRPLKLPPPLNEMWLKVNKIIDGLHLANHKRRDCKKLFNPNRIVEMYPELKDTKNTIVAEQTFVCCSHAQTSPPLLPEQNGEEEELLHWFLLQKWLEAIVAYCVSLCTQKVRTFFIFLWTGVGRLVNTQLRPFSIEYLYLPTAIAQYW